ncbi:MAG: hypothetical protein WC423_27375 [Vulcanimicrobiota bacterium]
MLWPTLVLSHQPEASTPVSRPLLNFSANPGKPVVLHQGHESRLFIRYGTELDPDRFHATLNGSDVTTYFTPEPRTAEAMRLPYKSGTNSLEFEVGRLPRPDLPKGTLFDSEVHRLEVILQEGSVARPMFSGNAVPVNR